MVNYFKECIKALTELHSSYPSFSIGRHLSTALSEYGDSWGMSDKELLFALQKYQAELEVDPVHVMDEEFVQKVVDDSRDILHILDEDNTEEEDY